MIDHWLAYVVQLDECFPLGHIDADDGLVFGCFLVCLGL